MLLLLFVHLWGGVCCLYGRESSKGDCNSLSWDVLPEVLPFRIKKNPPLCSLEGEKRLEIKPTLFWR